MPLDATPLSIATLPAIAAGPILRRLTRTEVAVWVALTRGDDLMLTVQPLGLPAASVTTPPVTPLRVGVNLWIATLTVGAPDGTFVAGQLYEYQLTSAGWPAPSWADFAIGTALPAFEGPPTSVEDLVVLHASCRKMHGRGRDGLGHTRTTIQKRINDGVSNPRPHLLVLSGDQIYADEIAAVIMPRVQRLATDLVGIDETSVFGTAPRIGGRQGPSEAFGLTSSAASNHLWTLGEYLATYLLSWSPALWPSAIPQWSDVAPDTDLDPASGLDEVSWNVTLDYLQLFRDALPDVRRVLATTPTLMILDDHEITDDWNLDYSWAARVYTDERARRIVTNGLVAYSLCQHWGNRPDRFATAGTPEAAVRGAVTFTGASPDTAEVRALLGVPTQALPSPPTALRDLSSPQSVRWDYAIGAAQGWPVRVIALDERSAREFARVDHPSARISKAALALMLPGPQPGDTEAVTLVVAPSPILGTHALEHVLQPAVNLFPGGSVYADFESWSAVTANHQELLGRLATYGPLVFLSGDVHYSTTGAFEYTRTGGGAAKAAQITSSSSKNADTKTMVMHLLGDLALKLGLERERTVRGFTALSNVQRAALASPPPAGTVLPYDDVVDILLGRVFLAGQESPAAFSKEVADAYGFVLGDWEYTVAPVDDEQMPGPGELLDHLSAVPTEWVGWNADSSWLTVQGLRASDLHRIGRVLVGLPEASLLTFETGPLRVSHWLTAVVGDHAGDTAAQHTSTKVVIG